MNPNHKRLFYLLLTLFLLVGCGTTVSTHKNSISFTQEYDQSEAVSLLKKPAAPVSQPSPLKQKAVSLQKCKPSEIRNEVTLACDLRPGWEKIEAPVETVRIVASNIKNSMAGWEADYARILAAKPDFIAMQEMSRRPMGALLNAEYDGWRQEGSYSTRATPVLWRKDRWKAVETGSRTLSNMKQKWGFRIANYATLESLSTGRVVTVVSGHACPTIPENYGCLQQFIANLKPLVEELSERGPVFVAGDFNNHYKSNHKDKLYWKSGIEKLPLVATMDFFGRMKTHDGGGSIDYMYGTKENITPLRQGAWDQKSDHLAIWSDWRLSSEPKLVMKKDVKNLSVAPAEVKWLEETVKGPG